MTKAGKQAAMEVTKPVKSVTFQRFQSGVTDWKASPALYIVGFAVDQPAITTHTAPAIPALLSAIMPGAIAPAAAAVKTPEAIQAIKCPLNTLIPVENPCFQCLAKRKIDISAIPMCIAIFGNHAKNMTCQNVNLLCPSAGTPVQNCSLATAHKSDTECAPSCGKTAKAAAIKIKSIQGKATLAKRAT